MQDNKAILETDNTYHIYNRANGNEILFLSDNNYQYFFKKYEEYVFPIAHTLCYCLMPNHFHFLVRVREERKVVDQILNRFSKSGAITKTLQGFQTLEGLPRQQAISNFLSQQFSHLFNGYSQAFNKQQNRKGKLFIHTFKRKLITDETYMRKLIHYIHYNPIEAGLTQLPEEWKYASYNSIISLTQTKLLRDEVIGYFGDMESFKYCHKYPPNQTGINP
jgi:REP element-mobilizing transposase RayT